MGMTVGGFGKKFVTPLFDVLMKWLWINLNSCLIFFLHIEL